MEMKKAKFFYIFPIVPVVLLFAGCPIEGNQAILTIKNQSSFEITKLTIWRGTAALEEAKLKMTEAEFNVVTFPSLGNVAALAAANKRYDDEVENTCRRSPEITDNTGLPVSAIKSWELNSGSIIVQAFCGDRPSSLCILNFGGDHALRFTGKHISNPNWSEDDW